MNLMIGVLFIYDVVASTQQIVNLDTVQQQIFYEALEAATDAVIVELGPARVSKVKFTGDGHFLFAKRASLALDLLVYLNQAANTVTFSGRKLAIQSGAAYGEIPFLSPELKEIRGGIAHLASRCCASAREGQLVVDNVLWSLLRNSPKLRSYGLRSRPVPGTQLYDKGLKDTAFRLIDAPPSFGVTPSGTSSLSAQTNHDGSRGMQLRDYVDWAIAEGYGTDRVSIRQATYDHGKESTPEQLQFAQSISIWLTSEDIVIDKPKCLRIASEWRQYLRESEAERWFEKLSAMKRAYYIGESVHVFPGDSLCYSNLPWMSPDDDPENVRRLMFWFLETELISSNVSAFECALKSVHWLTSNSHALDVINRVYLCWERTVGKKELKKWGMDIVECIDECREWSPKQASRFPNSLALHREVVGKCDLPIAISNAWRLAGVAKTEAELRGLLEQVAAKLDPSTDRHGEMWSTISLYLIVENIIEDLTM